MREIYRAKIGFGLIIPAGTLIIGVFILMIVQGAWLGSIIAAVVVANIVYFIATCYCVIDGDKLYVKAGFIVNETIDIDKITKIIPNNSLLSAPALPLNRLEIFYNRYDSLIVSPGDNAGFIARLKGLNSNIEVSSATS